VLPLTESAVIRNTVVCEVSGGNVTCNMFGERDIERVYNGAPGYEHVA